MIMTVIYEHLCGSSGGAGELGLASVSLAQDGGIHGRSLHTMLRRLILFLALALLGTVSAGCEPAPRAPLIVPSGDGGFSVLSPCGEPIDSVEVVKSLSSTSESAYWKATALPGRAVSGLILFVDNADYSAGGPVGPLEPASEYIVTINGGRGGTILIPRELGAKRGAWQTETFESNGLEQEQAKVKDLSCR